MCSWWGWRRACCPHDRSKVEGTLDEERRLLYVGITRAMRTLTMTYCRDRMKYGSAAPATRVRLSRSYRRSG